MQFLMPLIEALQYGFIRRALIVGTLIAICCAFLGVFLVLRRFAMIGDGLAHISFATIGVGLLLQTSPLYVAVPLTMASALMILQLTEKADVYGDAAIGLLSALGVAVGVTLASVGGGFNVDLFSYLFGDILTISHTEAWMAGILSLSIIGLTLLFYQELFALTFDEDYAHVLGINPRRMTQALILLTAVTVVLSIKVVGTMLVSSLIVFPAVTALQVARGFKLAILLAACTAVFSVITGIFLAYLVGLPAGASIVLLNFGLFVLAFLSKQLRKG
jgi:zinc transport system permease protein